MQRRSDGFSSAPTTGAYFIAAGLIVRCGAPHPGDELHGPHWRHMMTIGMTIIRFASAMVVATIAATALLGLRRSTPTSGARTSRSPIATRSVLAASFVGYPDQVPAIVQSAYTSLTKYAR